MSSFIPPCAIFTVKADATLFVDCLSLYQWDAPKLLLRDFVHLNDVSRVLRSYQFALLSILLISYAG